MSYKKSLNNSDLSTGDRYQRLIDKSYANDNQNVDYKEQVIPLLG